MKPANNTSKHTTCVTGGGGGSGVTCAPTSANTAAVGHKDASKRYGNGKTAAQIATQHGASAGTTLYGPGNSQPHKVQVCGKANGHWVDVHAVKNYSGAKCSTSSPAQKVTPGRSTIVSSAIGAVGATPASGSTAAGTSTQVAGGVLGVTA